MTTPRIEGPSSLLGSVLKTVSKNPQYDGGKVFTQIRYGNGFAFVETEKPLHELHADGVRKITWKKNDYVEIDSCPVFSIQPPG